MEKILVTEFSMLELHLGATNHISGGLVSRLLGMHRIQAATQRFKVILEHPSKVILGALYISYYMHSIPVKHTFSR
jgi:hypothetical protein